MKMPHIFISQIIQRYRLILFEILFIVCIILQIINYLLSVIACFSSFLIFLNEKENKIYKKKECIS